MLGFQLFFLTFSFCLLLFYKNFLFLYSRILFFFLSLLQNTFLSTLELLLEIFFLLSLKKNFKVFLLSFFFPVPSETPIYPFFHALFSTKNPFNLPQVPTWPSSFSVFFHSFPFFTFQVLVGHA